MPLTGAEVFSDLPDGMMLLKEIDAALVEIRKKPMEQRMLVDYAVAFKVPPESPIYQFIALVEKIEEQGKS